MIVRGKFLLAALLCCAGSALMAQMGISVSLNRQVYMTHEHIFACVTLRNNTGKPLLFGRDPALQGFILFDIRDDKERPVAKTKEELSVTGLLLGPGEVRKMVIPLDRYYRIDSPGRYRCYVFVSHNMLKNEYRSGDLYFRVSDGIEVWHKTVGMPDLTGKPKPEAEAGTDTERTYTIRVLSEGSVSSYYMLVEDKKHLFAVTKVGQIIGYERFQAEVDMLSRIHLLMPISPRVFHYIAFNTDGALLVSSYWKTQGTIPMLFRDSKSGKVTRIGGVEARAGVDFRDPKSGMMTVSEILEHEQQAEPVAPKDRGPVDLGKGVLPMDDEDEEDE